MLWWLFRLPDRKRWRTKHARKNAYTELAYQASREALAAAEGGYTEDGKILHALSQQLVRIAESKNGASAITLMKVMASEGGAAVND